MRGFQALPALAAVLVAGCGRTQADQDANAAIATPVAADAPANAGEPPPPPPSTGKTIPATLLGVYDASLEACGKPSDAHLTVAPTELRFHESIGTVRQVVAAGADTVSVEADYQGEGERWRSRRELKLGDGGATLTVSGDGTRLVRVRCPEGAR
jgi:ferric-dicitrate binding protein FerR (iron transport regulator)